MTRGRLTRPLAAAALLALIGTECVRADLLPAPEEAKVRELLRDYLGQRTLFYLTGDTHECG